MILAVLAAGALIVALYYQCHPRKIHLDRDERLRLRAVSERQRRDALFPFG